MALYTATDWLGLIPMIFAAGFALLGLVQWIRRKRLTKVDRTILLLGGFYVAVMAAYCFFERVVINYRPVIMEGKDHVEPSFPSTHTLLAIMILGSTFVIAKNLLTNVPLKRTLRILCFVFMFITAAARLLSGVHWLTDIIGAIFLGATLVFEYAGVIKHGIYLRTK